MIIIDSMPSLIKYKYGELLKNYPQNPEFSKWVKQSDLWNWIYSLMIIRGDKVHKTSMVKYIDAELDENLPLSLYAFAQSWQEIYNDQKRFIDMQTSLTLSMVCRWAKMLLYLDPETSDDDILRKNHVVVYEWEHIPVDESKVKSCLEDAIKNYVNSKKDNDNVLDSAMELHLELNKIYAFGENTIMMSMVVLMFCLLELGYPLPELSADDREYNRLMAEYTDTGKSEKIKDMFYRSIYNRVETVCSLAMAAVEAE